MWWHGKRQDRQNQDEGDPIQGIFIHAVLRLIRITTRETGFEEAWEPVAIAKANEMSGQKKPTASEDERVRALTHEGQ